MDRARNEAVRLNLKKNQVDEVEDFAIAKQKYAVGVGKVPTYGLSKRDSDGPLGLLMTRIGAFTEKGTSVFTGLPWNKVLCRKVAGRPDVGQFIQVRGTFKPDGLSDMLIYDKDKSYHLFVSAYWNPNDRATVVLYGWMWGLECLKCYEKRKIKREGGECHPVPRRDLYPMSHIYKLQETKWFKNSRLPWLKEWEPENESADLRGSELDRLQSRYTNTPSDS